jgi:hypothetical protein
MKTPMQELFYRIEQLRFAKNPIDELMMIRLQMLDKEKEAIVNAYNGGQQIPPFIYAEHYYKKTFNPQKDTDAPL